MKIPNDRGDSHDSNDVGAFRCVRCTRSDIAPVAPAPFPNELGRRIASEICTECWEAWKKHQMALINHYALNVRDAEARKYLTASMEGFLFGGDDEAGAGAWTPTEGGAA